MSFVQGHALIIGVGTYRYHPGLAVPVTNRDAAALAAVLRDPTFCGYPHDQVEVLPEAQTHRAGVLAALASLKDRVRSPDDTLFVFYAGHGQQGEDDYYLMTSDSRLVGNRVQHGTGLRAAELVAALRDVGAARVLLIVNACYAGALSPTLAADEPLIGTPLPDTVTTALLGTGSGRIIIGACRDKQVSFVGPGPLTLFTSALVDGLQGIGVSSNRGFISVFDLYDHLYQRLQNDVPRLVPATLRQHYGQTQEPELTALKGVGPFAVALHHGAPAPGRFDPTGPLPTYPGVRTVPPITAQEHQQQIGGQAQVDVAVSGNVYGDINTSSHRYTSTTIHVHQQAAHAPTTPRVPQMAPSLPAAFVPRPEAFDPLVALLTAPDQSEAVAITAALRGAGGYGKTTLAKAICQDRRIRAAFPDGILWVTLGEQVTDLAEKVVTLVTALEGTAAGISGLDQATRALDTALGNRRCLLVIDDIWKTADLEPFVQGGPHCTRLMTTRDAATLGPHTHHIPLDRMQQHEARAVLGQGVIGAERLTGALDALATRLGHWPLLLALVQPVLATATHDGMRLEDAIAMVQRQLDERGLTAFDAADTTDRNRAAALTIGVSLSYLSPVYRQRHAELAIFPEDSPITRPLLEVLWGATGGLDAGAVADVCTFLTERSLALDDGRASGALRLHDVVRTYLVSAHQRELAQWHAALLARCRPAAPTEGTAWWLLAPTHPLWETLAYHLEQAGRVAELTALVTDLRYLVQKAMLRGPLAAESDLRTALRCAPDDEPLRLLERTLRLAALLFLHTTTAAEYATVLLAQLDHLPLFRPHCAALAETIQTPHARLLHPVATGAHPALQRILVGHRSVVNSCSWSPDGQRVVSGGYDGTVRVWEVGSGKEIQRFTGHTDGVISCAFSPDGERVVSGEDDGTVRVWDVAIGDEVQCFMGHTRGVMSCAWSPDGQRVVSGGADGTVRVWDVGSGQEVQRFTIHEVDIFGRAVSYPPGHEVDIFGRAVSYAFSPDGERVVSVGSQGTVQVWDVGSGDEVQWFMDYMGHIYEVESCAFSPDGRRVVMGGDGGMVRVWDVASRKEVQRFTGHEVDRYGRAVRYAFSPDGERVVSGGHDGTVRVWDVGSGEEVQRFTGHTGGVISCAFSPDGRRLVSGGHDGMVRVWDVGSGQEVQRFTGHTGWVSSCAFSPDGRRLVCGGNDGTVWDVGSGEEAQRFTGHEGSKVTSCAFSPDGERVVGSDGTVQVWDVNGVAQWALPASRADWGQVLRQRRLLFRRSKAPVARLDPELLVRICLFHPGGQHILLVTGDGALRLWNPESNQLHVLFHTDEKLLALAIAPDGTQVAIGGQRGVIYFLRLVGVGAGR